MENVRTRPPTLLEPLAARQACNHPSVPGAASPTGATGARPTAERSGHGQRQRRASPIEQANLSEGAISDDELDGATSGTSESVPDKFDPLLIEIIGRKQGVLYGGHKYERKA